MGASIHDLMPTPAPGAGGCKRWSEENVGSHRKHSSALAHVPPSGLREGTTAYRPGVGSGELGPGWHDPSHSLTHTLIAGSQDVVIGPPGGYAQQTRGGLAFTHPSLHCISPGRPGGGVRAPSGRRGSTRQGPHVAQKQSPAPSAQPTDESRLLLSSAGGHRQPALLWRLFTFPYLLPLVPRHGGHGRGSRLAHEGTG